MGNGGLDLGRGWCQDPKVPTLCHVTDVDTGMINGIKADLMTHIVPRV